MRISMHEASGRAIGRALPCRRIIICAPVRRCKGSRRHPLRYMYLAPPPSDIGMDFFSLARRSPLESGATPEFRSSFATSLFWLSFSSSSSRLEIDRRSLEHAWIATTFCRRIFAFLSVVRHGLMRAATSVTAAVTMPTYSKPSWANDTSRSDEFEGRRDSAGDFGTEDADPFPTPSRLLIIDVAAILPCILVQSRTRSDDFLFQCYKTLASKCRYNFHQVF